MGIYTTTLTTRDHMLTVDEAREMWKIASLEEKVMLKTYREELQYISLVVMTKLFSRSRLHTGSFKVFLLFAIIAIASAATVYAYLQLNPEQSSTRAVTVAPPREFSIRLEKTEFEPRELVHINLTLKNVGNETFTHYWHVMVGFDFDVLDANGTVIYTATAAWMGAAVIEPVTLDPGEEFTLNRFWNQTRLITAGDTLFGEVPVEKGTYQIAGKLNGWGEMEMVTPPVAIAIK